MPLSKGRISSVAVTVMALLPLLGGLGGCETKQQREENARLKSQVESLTRETSDLRRQVDASQQEQSRLQAQVEELNQKVHTLEAQKAAAAKPPAKAASKATVKPTTTTGQKAPAKK